MDATHVCVYMYKTKTPNNIRGASNFKHFFLKFRSRDNIWSNHLPRIDNRIEVFLAD